MEPWFAALARPTAAVPSAAATTTPWPGAPPEPARCANEQGPPARPAAHPSSPKPQPQPPSHPRYDRSLFQRRTTSSADRRSTPILRPQRVTGSGGTCRVRGPVRRQPARINEAGRWAAPSVRDTEDYDHRTALGTSQDVLGDDAVGRVVSRLNCETAPYGHGLDDPRERRMLVPHVLLKLGSAPVSVLV